MIWDDLRLLCLHDWQQHLILVIDLLNICVSVMIINYHYQVPFLHLWLIFISGIIQQGEQWYTSLVSCIRVYRIVYKEKIKANVFRMFSREMLWTCAEQDSCFQPVITFSVTNTVCTPQWFILPIIFSILLQ